MSEDKKQKGSLTDEDMITSPKLSRRVLLATAGVALGAAALGGKSAIAEEMDKDNDAEGAEDKDKDSDEGDAEMDKDNDAEGAEDKDPDEGEEEMDAD